MQDPNDVTLQAQMLIYYKKQQMRNDVQQRTLIRCQALAGNEQTSAVTRSQKVPISTTTESADCTSRSATDTAAAVRSKAKSLIHLAKCKSEFPSPQPKQKKMPRPQHYKHEFGETKDDLRKITHQVTHPPNMHKQNSVTQSIPAQRRPEKPDEEIIID